MHEKRFDHGPEMLRSPERVRRLEMEWVVGLALTGLEKDISVLDVGTGSGLFAEAFSKAGARAAGVDAQAEMLEAARKLVPGVEFREATAEALPFPDASFGLVFLGLVLHETDDPLKALREAHRVGRRGAAVLEWPAEAQDFGPPLEHRLSRETIAAMAKDAGFREIQVTGLTDLVFYRMLS